MQARFPKFHLPAERRIADAVYHALRRAIIRHELTPGTHLSVPALALRMGTSRSPVHEAIKRLVQEGLATEEPHRGAFVTTYDTPALIPLYEVRAALEALAAALAAERADSMTIRKLEDILAAEAKAIARDNLEHHIEVDIEFHRTLLAASANPVLQEMLGQIYERIHSAMIARVVPTGPERALADHRRVLKAIQERDGLAAAEAAKAHVMNVYARLAAKRLATVLAPAQKSALSEIREPHR